MKTVLIAGAAITDELSLHHVFADAMGFPGFYGGNWNAWIDCMCYLTEPSAEMSSIHIADDEELRVSVIGGLGLQARMPELIEALIDCSAFVNQRFVDRGEAARITIVLEDAG